MDQARIEIEQSSIDMTLSSIRGLGPFMDRSKVHILLCDKDPSTGQQALDLLRKCSYQVTAVKTARQVIEVLNSSGSEIDLILSEVDLPKEKGFKLLRHIMRHERHNRIPIVMMSERDEMAVVTRCLRLGAMDYLVKPLRSNELLNLWTHVWRRRRMMGLTDKHVINGSLSFPSDPLICDTGESNNTKSTNLFSDETDDGKRTISTTQGTNTLATRDSEWKMSPQLELSLRLSSDFSAEKLTERNTKAGLLPPPPRKTELKVGQSSAFLTYAKDIKQSNEQSANVESNGRYSNQSNKPTEITEHGRDSTYEGRELLEIPLIFPQQQITFCVPSIGPAGHLEGTKTPSRIENGSGEVDRRDGVGICCNQSSLPCDSTIERVCHDEQFPTMHSYEHYRGHVNDAAPSPELRNSGFINPTMCSPQVVMPPAFQLYHDFTRNNLPPNHALPLTNTFSYYPLAHVTSPHFVPFPAWPTMLAAPMTECKLSQAERRKAALNKFRLKRKERCFEKKIRYVSRKKLAEQRPRIRGQFVRRTNDLKMTENGVVGEYDEEEADDEQGCSELEAGSSPESMAENSKNGSTY